MLAVATAFSAFGEVFVKGATEGNAASADVEGELGLGGSATDGSTDATWTWTKGSWNRNDGNNDEYKASVTPAALTMAYSPLTL